MYANRSDLRKAKKRYLIWYVLAFFIGFVAFVAYLVWIAQGVLWSFFADIRL